MQTLRDFTAVVELAFRSATDYIEDSIQYSSERAVTWTGEPIVQKKFAPAWKTSRKSELALKAMAGLERASGKPARTRSYGFCTDGSGVIRYRELFPDRKVDVIGYGPGSEENAHTVNESISLNEFRESYAGFQGIVMELLKKK